MLRRFLPSSLAEILLSLDNLSDTFNEKRTVAGNARNRSFALLLLCAEFLLDGTDLRALGLLRGVPALLRHLGIDVILHTK